MATKLDNVDPKKSNPDDVSDLIEQEEVDISDLGQSPMFDAEGNLIEDVDDEDSEEQTEEVVDETAEALAGQTETPTAKAKKTLSPAEIAIIELKKENKLKEKRLQELETRIAQQAKAKDDEQGIAKYVADGHDEETAKRLYTDDQRYQRLEERTAILDFREENSEVFAKYPQAKANVKQIMQIVNNSKGFMTAEQVCAGIYGAGKPEREARAIAAARGDSTRQVDDSGRTLSRAERAGSAAQSQTLDADEIRDKKRLERIMKQKISDADYIAATRNR